MQDTLAEATRSIFSPFMINIWICALLEISAAIVVLWVTVRIALRLEKSGQSIWSCLLLTFGQTAPLVVILVGSTMSLVLRHQHYQASLDKWLYQGNSLVVTLGLVLVGIALLMFKRTDGKSSHG